VAAGAVPVSQPQDDMNEFHPLKLADHIYLPSQGDGMIASY
jgi:hypothetical protein